MGDAVALEQPPIILSEAPPSKIETSPDPNRDIDRFFHEASGYLIAKQLAAGSKSDSEKFRMRLKGAELQQHLAAFVIDNYNPSRDAQSRQELRQELEKFWHGYHQLVLQPLVKRGTNFRPDTGLPLVFSLQQGVRGIIATTFMAKSCGWEVTFPTAEDDVKYGKDLMLKKPGQTIFLQVKCPEGAIFSVWKEPESKLIRVTIPAQEEFYLDPELGIPHRSKSEKFNNWLCNQLNSQPK